MKFYLTNTVYEEALSRIEWVYTEFDNVTVNFSGGKDSTVVLQLALIVAEKLNKLPVKVDFIDQEAEWQMAIDYIRETFDDDRLLSTWFQMPIHISNGTSERQSWLECWEEGAEWIREKETNSIQDNVYGTKTFADLFDAISQHRYGNAPVARIAGIRTEESPARRFGLTTYETYKGRTWGSVENKKNNHYVFYPIYDWGYTDVWKAIHDHKWQYCKLYDMQYQYGIPIRSMRVSNLHHETAIKSLFYLQEFEPKTWNKVAKRLFGINTASQLQMISCPKTLPYMFESWVEYRDYLLEHLINNPERREVLRTRFEAHTDRYIPKTQLLLTKAEISTILVNDVHGVKYSTFHAAHSRDTYKYRNDRGLPLTGSVDGLHIELDSTQKG